MREVDDPHDAEDQRQPNPEQRISAAEDDRIQDVLEEFVQIFGLGSAITAFKARAFQRQLVPRVSLAQKEVFTTLPSLIVTR